MVKRRSSEVLPVCGNSGRVSTSRRAARCKEPPHGLVGLGLPAAEQSIYNIIYIYNIYSYTYTWNFLGPPMAWALGRRYGRLGSELGLRTMLYLLMSQISGNSHTKGLLSSVKFGNLATVALFVFIWQLVFNHGLIRLKTFVSQFPTKLCN